MAKRKRTRATEKRRRTTLARLAMVEIATAIGVVLGKKHGWQPSEIDQFLKDVLAEAERKRTEYLTGEENARR